MTLHINHNLHVSDSPTSWLIKIRNIVHNHDFGEKRIAETSGCMLIHNKKGTFVV